MVSDPLSTTPQKQSQNNSIEKAIGALIYRPATSLSSTLYKSLLISKQTALIRKGEQSLGNYRQVTFLRLAHRGFGQPDAEILAVQVTPSVAFLISLARKHLLMFSYSVWGSNP